MIRDEELQRRNSIHRARIRQIEKNRFPKKCRCTVCGGRFEIGGIEEYFAGPHVCSGCSLRNKVKVHRGTLYQLIKAVPQEVLNRNEIDAADFRVSHIPLPLQSNWGWRKFDEWLEEGLVLCGLTSRAALGRDALGLRDYAELTRLPTKFGKLEHAYRQKAASPVQHIWVIAPHWQRSILDSLNRLPTPRQQQLLRQCGRLYKKDCLYPWRGKERRAFDKYQALSWEVGAKEYTQGANVFKAEQRDIERERLSGLEKLNGLKPVRTGGREVTHPEGSAKRHMRLVSSQAKYGELCSLRRWDSCWNGTGLGRSRQPLGFWDDKPKPVLSLSKIYQERCTLNIDIERNVTPEKIERRDIAMKDLTSAYTCNDETGSDS